MGGRVLEDGLDPVADGRVWFEVLRIDALPQAVTQLVVLRLHKVLQLPFRIAHDPKLGSGLELVLFLSPGLKVHYGVLDPVEVELWELDSQIEMLEAPLFFFIDNLDLSVGEAVQPIHRHDAPFPVLLDQLAQSRHLGPLGVQLGGGLRVLAPVRLHPLPDPEVENPLPEAPLGAEYGDGRSPHDHRFPRAVYVVDGEAEDGGLGDVVVVGREEDPLVPVPALGEGLVSGLCRKGERLAVREYLGHHVQVGELALVESRELEGGVFEQRLYALVFSVAFQRSDFYSEGNVQLG